MQPTSFFHKDDVSDKLQTVSMTEYMLLDNLTEEEKNALRDYQDNSNKQHEFDCKIDESIQHTTCYVLNSSLRDPYFKASLTKNDAVYCDCLTENLDSAISKNQINEDLILIKGLDDAKWMCVKKIDEDYYDDGYGSFTVDIGKLDNYATPQKIGVYTPLPDESVRVLIVQRVKKGHKGVYMGASEEEVLLPRGIHYAIRNITVVPVEELFKDTKAIIYYVEEI